MKQHQQNFHTLNDTLREIYSVKNRLSVARTIVPQIVNVAYYRATLLQVVALKLEAKASIGTKNIIVTTSLVTTSVKQYLSFKTYFEAGESQQETRFWIFSLQNAMRQQLLGGSAHNRTGSYQNVNQKLNR